MRERAVLSISFGEFQNRKIDFANTLDKIRYLHNFQKLFCYHIVAYSLLINLLQSMKFVKREEMLQNVNTHWANFTKLGTIIYLLERLQASKSAKKRQRVARSFKERQETPESVRYLCNFMNQMIYRVKNT